MKKKKLKCARCEALERKQKNKNVQLVNNVPLCDICIAEVAEEELFFTILAEEVDEFGGKSFD